MTRQSMSIEMELSKHFGIETTYDRQNMSNINLRTGFDDNVSTLEFLSLYILWMLTMAWSYSVSEPTNINEELVVCGSAASLSWAGYHCPGPGDCQGRRGGRRSAELLRLRQESSLPALLRSPR